MNPYSGRYNARAARERQSRVRQDVHVILFTSGGGMIENVQAGRRHASMLGTPAAVA